MFKLIKTKLIFVDRGVKINSTYCFDVLLTEQLLCVVVVVVAQTISNAS